MPDKSKRGGSHWVIVVMAIIGLGWGLATSGAFETWIASMTSQVVKSP
ncbi:MAG: hypothetical protein NW216_13575 [Hyphomicrobium sp.]|nr:hypothetical protein [Hyphomicrobium sp.]